MSEWKSYTIDELKADYKTAIAIGPFGSRMKSDCYQSSGIPVIRGNNISDLPGFFGEFVFISKEKAKELESSRIYESDLVFPHRGNIGEVGIVTGHQSDEYVMSSSLMKLTCNKEIVDPWFIYYFFKSNLGRRKLLQNSSQVGTPGIATPLTSLKSLEVFLPPLDEQKEIINVLCHLDHKIENLRKQNETLEKIAQTLFKHWFIDFEFPFDFTQGKPSINGKPYKSSGGAMVSSQLGEIPADWSVEKLGDFCGIKHGYAFKGAFITTEETDKILLTPGNFRIGGGFNSSKYKYYLSNDYGQDYILEPGALILTMTDLSKEGDTLGYPAFVPIKQTNVFLHNQRIGKIINSQLDSVFLFFLLCRREYRAHILGTASGSTVRHTSPSRILEYKFAVPNQDLLAQFSVITTNLINKTHINCEQIDTLTKTRDTLLPRLMNGQIRVRQ